MDAARDQHDNGSPSSQDPWFAFIQSRLAHVLDVTLRDQPDRVADARQAMDEELAAMQEAMCSLRAHRNALAPVSSLPSEVLARIFWFFSDPDMQKDAPSRLKWIIVTQVSRHWRDSALQHPNLWNEPNFYLGSKWVRLMLARAKTVPLSIEYLLSNPKSKSNLILSHISDIHHLSLRGITQDLQSFLQSVQSPARIMESLKLSAWVNGPDRDRILLDYRDMFPRLLRIELVSVPMRWSSPILSGLTHLKVTFHDVTPTIIWPEGNARVVSIYSQFFLALERMSALEVLILRNALPFRPQHPSQHHTVMLSHLRTLSFDDVPGRCFDILKQLSFPSSCFLSLEGRGHISIDDIIDVHPVLSNHTRSIDGSHPHVLATRIEQYRTEYIIQLRIWRNCTSPTGESETLSLHFHMLLPPDISTIDALYDALSLDNLRIVSVKYTDGLSWFVSRPQPWIELFGRCRALEEMHLDSNYTVLQFIAALGMPVPPRSGQDVQEGLAGERVFVENLRLLVLRGVDLDARVPNETTTICESIVQGLVARKQINASLPSIRVFSDGVGSKSRKELEKVAHVDWLSEDVESEVRHKYRNFL